MTVASAPTVSLRAISKTFSGNRVLSNFDLELWPGVVHGLVGQNGSGKSTLVKILSGFQSPDPGGELYVKGDPVQLPLLPGSSRRYGISFVHQDLALIDDVSICDNLWVGRYQAGIGWYVNKRELMRRTAEALRTFGLDVDPGENVNTLSAGQKATLAIVRAVLEVADEDHATIVLDEPTARLGKDDTRRLFDAMNVARENGAALLFISHRLDEILEMTDRITVLRGGVVAGDIATSECDEDRLIEMIVGSKLGNLFPEPTRPAAAPIFEARRLAGDVVNDVSFSVGAGEVLGLTGLPGAGFDEIPYLIMGARKYSGTVKVKEKELDLSRSSINDRIASGLAFVPGDRARQGAAMTLSVGENVTLPRIHDFVRKAFLSARTERLDAMATLREFDVRPPNPGAMVGVLSGGNQQKSIIAKWLRTDPDVLLLHEPTQGVDVGARKQIFEMISALAASGRGVILASMEYEHLAHLAHRVLVLRHGIVAGELQGTDLTKERILEECYRV